MQTNWFKILLVKIQCMIFYYNTDTFAWEKYVHRLIIPLTYMICDILFSWTVGFIGENANKRQWFSIFKMILSGAELFWDRVYRIYIYILQPVNGCYQSTCTNFPVIWNVQYSYKTGTRITWRMVRIGKANVPQSLEKCGQKYI